MIFEEQKRGSESISVMLPRVGKCQCSLTCFAGFALKWYHSNKLNEICFVYKMGSGINVINTFACVVLIRNVYNWHILGWVITGFFFLIDDLICWIKGVSQPQIYYSLPFKYFVGRLWIIVTFLKQRDTINPQRINIYNLLDWILRMQMTCNLTKVTWGPCATRTSDQCFLEHLWVTPLATAVLSVDL